MSSGSDGLNDGAGRDSSAAFVGAFGLVRTQSDDAIRYLTIRTEAGLDFVRAEREEGAGYRESLDTAVVQQLGLRSGRDYIISSVPRAHLNSRLCGGSTGGADRPVWYVCQFFVINLFGAGGRRSLSGREDVVWLSPRDVYRGHGPDGTRLRPDLRELLKIADAVPADELCD